MDELEISEKKKKFLFFRIKRFLMTWYLLKTTIGDNGTPSGRNVGPARPGNPAESG